MHFFSQYDSYYHRNKKMFLILCFNIFKELSGVILSVPFILPNLTDCQHTDSILFFSKPFETKGFFTVPY